MRFVLGPIPKSEVFDALAAGWTPLPERNVRKLAATALMLALPLMAIAVIVFLQSRAEVRAAFRESPLTLAAFIIGMLAIVPAHELVHALAYFKSPLSRHLILGAWPRHGLAYAIYDGPMPRGRVLFMVAAPFLVLSVLPLTLLALGVPPAPQAARAMLLFGALTHTALCVGDSIVFWRIARHAPPGAMIHNAGWTTCWMRRETSELR